jgi:hypothetical protein
LTSRNAGWELNHDAVAADAAFGNWALHGVWDAPSWRLVLEPWGDRVGLTDRAGTIGGLGFTYQGFTPGVRRRPLVITKSPGRL